MATKMLKCEKCKSYGFKVVCTCGEKRINPKPAKYSVEDKYGKYRRMARET